MAAPARERRRSTAARAEALRLEGSRLTASGNYRAANAAYRRALRLAERCDPPDVLLFAAVLNDFGVLCKFTGKFADAEKMYRRAVKLVRRATGGRSHEAAHFLATLHHNLGGIEHARGRYAPALMHARKGVALRKGIRPRDRLALAADEAALAAILADMGRSSEGARIYRRVVRYYGRVLGERHYETGTAWASLGALCWKMGGGAAAERDLRRGIRILESILGRNHPRIASAMNNLAVVCAGRGKIREAGELYKRVLWILARQKGTTYPPREVVKRNYAKLSNGAA